MDQEVIAIYFSRLRMFDAVFVAVSHWMHKAASKQKTAISLNDTAHQLAQCVRFPMLSNDFLHFVVSQVKIDQIQTVGWYHCTQQLLALLQG